MRTKIAEKPAAAAGETKERSQAIPIEAWMENSFAVPFLPARKSARVLFYVTAVSTPEPDALYPLADWLRANGVSFAMNPPVPEDSKEAAH